jgi:hypothetical protein
MPSCFHVARTISDAGKIVQRCGAGQTEISAHTLAQAFGKPAASSGASARSDNRARHDRPPGRSTSDTGAGNEDGCMRAYKNVWQTRLLFQVLFLERFNGR